MAATVKIKVNILVQDTSYRGKYLSTDLRVVHCRSRISETVIGHDNSHAALDYIGKLIEVLEYLSEESTALS